MKAVVFHGVGDIRLDDVPEPTLQEPTDAIIRLTANAICGSDLHAIRGTQPKMKQGNILGHEGVGIVEQIGSNVKEIKIGDRVVVSSGISCGQCENCRRERYDLCLKANPNGPKAVSAIFGGTEPTGSYPGLQAEKARIPFADNMLVKLPPSVSDDQAILLSDMFPTGYYAAEIAQVQPGNTVAVFGCGPVGLFCILSAQLLGAGRIFAVDTLPDRLAMARNLGAEVIDYNANDPVKTIKQLTGNIGVDRAIDAVGVEANRPHHGFQQVKAVVANAFAKSDNQPQSPSAQANPQGDNWHPGEAPVQALTWCVNALAKAGTMAVIGVYPQTMEDFPLGLAMNKNITITGGHCPQRKYIPHLIELVSSGAVDPLQILTQKVPLTSAIDAYKSFDERDAGWVKVKLEPVGSV